MTRRRWIADEVDGDRAALTGDNARHLANVLRARVGQQFDVADGGSVRAGTVTAVREDRVEFALGDEVTAAGQDSAGVELVLAVFKFDRMEWAIEKATELGVAAIVPVIARRTNAHLATAAAKRVERWRKLTREAAQQSRRADVPEVADPVKLKQALAGFAGLPNRIVLSEADKVLSLRQSLSSVKTGERIVLAVGPEGGWTQDELKLFADQGWTATTLGPTILRAETAAIAGIATVNAQLCPE